MNTAIQIQQEPDLSDLVVVCAIRQGATPRALETAITERQDRGRVDPLLALAGETGAGLTLIHELINRWGIYDAD